MNMRLTIIVALLLFINHSAYNQFIKDNEPAKFVIGLAKLIAKNENRVNVGIEIPENKMTLFLQSKKPEDIINCEFFVEENIDGRNGEAWYKLVKILSQDPKMKLFLLMYRRKKTGIR